LQRLYFGTAAGGYATLEPWESPRRCTATRLRQWAPHGTPMLSQLHRTTPPCSDSTLAQLQVAMLPWNRGNRRDDAHPPDSHANLATKPSPCGTLRLSCSITSFCSSDYCAQPRVAVLSKSCGNRRGSTATGGCAKTSLRHQSPRHSAARDNNGRSG
jgi:hypothetical protein